MGDILVIDKLRLLALSNCLPASAILSKILAKHGIHNLSVETYSEDEECRVWSYDTVLMDEDSEDEE